MNWKAHLDSKYFQLGNQTAGQLGSFILLE